MSSSSPPSPMPAAAPVSLEERERVVRALELHFASDRLTLDEFEDRLTRAYRAATAWQLSELVADLPAVGVAGAGAMVALRAPADGVPARGFLAGVFGGVERRGSWVVPAHLKVVVAAGGAVLDLREARFGPGETVIEILCLMGGVEVLVPPGIRVEGSGAAFMGGFDVSAGDATAWSPLHPTVRLSGMAIMGGVEVHQRLPGESARDAKRRQRAEAKRRYGG